jgi:hypothetical protein
VTGAHDLQSLQRRMQRRRHRHHATRAPFRRPEHTVTDLLIDGDGPRDEVDVFSPTQRLHLANAQPRLAGQTRRRIPLAPFLLRRLKNARVLDEVPADDFGTLNSEQPDFRHVRDQKA